MQKKTLIPITRIENLIIRVRGLNIMIDRDLAELYQVQTKVLNKAVTRNKDRFPSDFMFQLTKEEFSNLKCPFDLSRGRRRLRVTHIQIISPKNLQA
ncbi:MAG: ORF6N domain-containing protein [candidate division Zixibacteria bacterium]|nr:ORF6N domain-containing protein [candidate division Zixibacteria bacterium]